ncbi:hypothetical protein ACJX0J_016937, partial [Zea mays]
MVILLICIYNNFYIGPNIIFHSLTSLIHIAASTIIHAHLVGVYFVFHLVGVYFVFIAFHLPVLVLAGQSSWRGNENRVSWAWLSAKMSTDLYLFELCFIPRIMEGVLSTITKEDMPHFLMQIVLLRIQIDVNLFHFLYKDLSHMYVDGLNKMMPSTLWLFIGARYMWRGLGT